MKRAAKRATRRHGTGNGNSPLLRPLSPREQRFVQFFDGNATRTAKRAGYSPRTAASQGSRLLRKVNIRKAIEERTKADPAVWAREDLQAWWTAVTSGTSPHKRAALRDRLKASELLGRSQAVFTDNVAHSGKVTLEQALTASREEGADV